MQQPKIIETFFAALKAGDPEAAASCVREDAVFIGVRAEPKAAVPIYGEYVGHDGLKRFLATLARMFSQQSLMLEHVGAGEGVEFASGRLEHITAATGKVFSSEWALRCRVTGGKISHYQFYEDSARLEESLSPVLEIA